MVYLCWVGNHTQLVGVPSPHFTPHPPSPTTQSQCWAQGRDLEWQHCRGSQHSHRTFNSHPQPRQTRVLRQLQMVVLALVLALVLVLVPVLVPVLVLVLMLVFLPQAPQVVRGALACMFRGAAKAA